MTHKGPAVGSGQWTGPWDQRGLSGSAGTRARGVGCRRDIDLPLKTRA